MPSPCTLDSHPLFDTPLRAELVLQGSVLEGPDAPLPEPCTATTPLDIPPVLRAGSPLSKFIVLVPSLLDKLPVRSPLCRAILLVPPPTHPAILQAGGQPLE